MKLSELNRVHPGIGDGCYFIEIEEVERSIKELMTYAPWTKEQIEAGEVVRDALAKAYFAILSSVPSSPSRTRALNLLTDARMLANQAITFKGEV